MLANIKVPMIAFILALSIVFCTYSLLGGKLKLSISHKNSEITLNLEKNEYVSK